MQHHLINKLIKSSEFRAVLPVCPINETKRQKKRLVQPVLQKTFINFAVLLVSSVEMTPCSYNILTLCRSFQVEFEWLRQYWFQGRRFARFCSWWTKPMEQMEKDWKEMERMVRVMEWTVSRPAQNLRPDCSWIQRLTFSSTCACLFTNFG